MSTSKDSVTESAKETTQEKPEEGKGVGNAEDDEPLVSWIFVQRRFLSNFLNGVFQFSEMIYDCNH